MTHLKYGFSNIGKIVEHQCEPSYVLSMRSLHKQGKEQIVRTSDDPAQCQTTELSPKDDSETHKKKLNYVKLYNMDAH